MQVPQHYEFLNHTKIISGKKALEHIPFELTGYDSRKPLVLTSPETAKRGAVKKLLPAFSDSTITVGAVYDGVPEYVGIGLVRDLGELFRARGCDCIIALGSGTVVDAAKALNILVSEKSGDILAFFEGKPLDGGLKPLLYLPDGSSAGTEMTSSVTMDNRRMTSELLYPDLVVIDPRVARGCCSRHAAEASVIAMANAVGAAVQEPHNPMVDAYVFMALRYLAEHMPKGIRRPGNRTAGMALANACVAAAIASSNAPAGLALLLADELANLSGVSRGSLLRAVFPPAITFMAEKKKAMRDEIFQALAGFEEFSATPKEKRPMAGLEKIMALMKSTGKHLPATLRELRIPRHVLAEAAGAAAAKSDKRYTEAECMAVLEKAAE